MAKSPVQIPNLTSLQLPKVPPTPAPRPRDQIREDANQRFYGITWILKDPTHKLEDYFQDADYWEPYSETKSYSKRPYQARYKDIFREYVSHLYILEEEGHNDYYVVAKRLPNKLEQLEPYCPCITCQSSRCNPLKYLWCAHCTKCIKGGIMCTDSYHIEQAEKSKALVEQRRQNPTKWDKYKEMVRSVKVLEGALVILMGLILLWVLN